MTKLYDNPRWIKKMYIDKKLSISSIAQLCHVTLTVIHRRLIRFKIPRRSEGGRIGIHHHHWKGFTISHQGYKWISLQSGQLHLRQISKTHHYVPEQILIVEKFLKRPLTKQEAVHHINENKQDNRIANLYLFPNEAEHQRYHQKSRRGSGIRITKSNLLSKYE